MKKLLESLRNLYEDNEIWIVPLVLIFIIIFASLVLSHTSCDKYAELGIETTWNLTTGCLAKHPTLGWMPVNNYFNTINLYLP